MDRRRGWLQQDGWWRKEDDWRFELKFSEETEKKFDEDNNTELQLQEVVEQATHINGRRGDGAGISILFDAMELSKPSRMEQFTIHYSRLTDADVASLARAIESGCLKSLNSFKISGTNVENGYVNLAKAMAFSGLTSLKTLTLSDVSFNGNDLKAYGAALNSGKLPNLSCLNITRNGIGYEGFEFLFLAIRSGKLNNLAELSLEENLIGDEGLIALADCLRDGVPGRLPNLSSLDLTGNRITEVGLLSLGDALSSGLLPNLSNLRMFRNKIGFKGAKALALAIRSGKLKNLAELSLGENNIRDEGLIALADSLRDGVPGPLPNLSSLDLTGNCITEAGLFSLGDALSAGLLPNLSNLRMFRNRIGYKGAKALALAIRSGNLKNLAELSLGENDIRDEGLIALADSLQDGVPGPLPNLTSLELGWNSITEVGLLSLRDALSSGLLPNLSCLRMSHNEIGDEVAKSLALAIRSGELKNLAELDLDGNNIGDEGLIALADSFREGIPGLLPNLSFLHLSYNSFTEVGLLALAEALKSGRLNSLKNLFLVGDSPTSEKGVSALVSALLTNNVLTVDVHMDEWRTYVELDRRRSQLLERNERNRNILAGLVTVPPVQATFGKVYICGNPEVGKTTLSRTLQRSTLESLTTWERRPHVEKRTRGIDVSQLSSKGNKPDENPITLLVWDMAGQEDFHVVHNAFFPDLGSAEGKATTFIVVCSSENSIEDSMKQLEYWLRYIASSCDKSNENCRHVFVVMNNFRGGQKVHQHAEQWKPWLGFQRNRFEQHLKIQMDLFLVDVRKSLEVRNLKNRLFEHARNLLRDQFVPDLCHAIQENLSVLNQRREQFPVLQWTEFMEEVRRLTETWPEDTILAATKYLNEAGVIIYIDTEGVRLVVVDPNWLCREILGRVFLPWHMASSSEGLFRRQVDPATGSISVSNFKRFFKSLKSEWNEGQVDDLIAILLWLGLCYKGREKNIFLPALIAEKRSPGDPWRLQPQVDHLGDQWVMGFCVLLKKSEVALAPISLWHRFQVDLAQIPKFNGERLDNDFVADKYFVTFVVDYMSVLIEVDAILDKPTFEAISILVKPRFEREELNAVERKQRQVDLADDLVERLLMLWNQICPGVEYEQKVIWPWPASCPRPKDKLERNLEVAKVKNWVREHGVGRKMQWVVGSGDPITEDQLLPTKDKSDPVFFSSRTSGIKADARQLNDSLYELYKPESTPKIQIVFFHGLQMEDYEDAHLSAWQGGDGCTIWPQTWLVEEVSGAHVLSVSYNGGLKNSLCGTMDMYNIRENLLSDLLQGDVGQVPRCPVVLVGHSIGGLVIKELCCLAHNKLHSSKEFERTKLEKFLKNMGGIFYYSTPHHGTGVAEILASKFSSPLSTYFETLSKETARLNNDFDRICTVNYKDWSFAGLGEALPTNLGSLKVGKYFVVTEASARGEDFNVVGDADHFSVCRPKSKTVRSFSKLRDFVSRVASNATDS